MTGIAWLLLRLFGPFAVVVLVAAVVGWVRRRRHQLPVHGWSVAGDPVARQAWASAHLAHMRLAQLEARVHDLEHHPTGRPDQPGDSR